MVTSYFCVLHSVIEVLLLGLHVSFESEEYKTFKIAMVGPLLSGRTMTHAVEQKNMQSQKNLKYECYSKCSYWFSLRKQRTRHGVQLPK